MNDFVQHIIFISTIVAALGTITNCLVFCGKSSKKSVDKYIDNRVSPVLKDIKDSIDGVKDEIKTNKIDADSDKMQRLRYECLCFASDIRKGEPKTRQEYEEVFRMEKEYDRLIEQYDIENGFMEEEMLFVHEQYRKLSND